VTVLLRQFLIFAIVSLNLGDSTAVNRNNVALRTSSFRRACVGCDSCNGAGGNHQTFAGGGRDGVAHPCFEGSTCLSHSFSSGCGGNQTEEDASMSESISWASIAAADPRQLQELLSANPDRWSLSDDRHAMQWTDCYGTLVASIPMSEGQVAIAEAIAAEQQLTR